MSNLSKPGFEAAETDPASAALAAAANEDSDSTSSSCDLEEAMTSASSKRLSGSSQRWAMLGKSLEADLNRISVIEETIESCYEENNGYNKAILDTFMTV